jgi:hypothetical protein
MNAELQPAVQRIDRGVRIGAVRRRVAGLTHAYAHVVEMNEESYRLKDGERKRTAKPGALSLGFELSARFCRVGFRSGLNTLMVNTTNRTGGC